MSIEGKSASDQRSTDIRLGTIAAHTGPSRKREKKREKKRELIFESALTRPAFSSPLHFGNLPFGQRATMEDDP